MVGPFYNEDSAKAFDDLLATLQRGQVHALVGAGLSASTHPSWKRLHADFESRSGSAPPRPFRAETAAIDFKDFRDLMGAEAFLEHIKDVFAQPVTQVPELYRLLDDTAGIGTLATTNFDENLASAASYSGRAHLLTSYSRAVNGSWYVYLHGRARTAETPADLVICSDDYDQAYGFSGSVFALFNAYLLTATVFLGTSLQDPDLDGMMKAAYRFRADRGNVGGPWYAVLPAKENPANGDRPLGEHVAIESRRLRAIGVEPIWYIRDDDHSNLRTIILRMRWASPGGAPGTTFLEAAGRMDTLASRDSPNSSEITEAIDLIRNVPEYARYFLSKLTSEAWFQPLYDAGILSAAAEPVVESEGHIRVIPWPAASYMRALASKLPSAVVSVTEALADTENWHVQNVLAELAAGLPPAKLRQVLPILLFWLANQRATGLIDHYLTTAFTRCVRNSHDALALALLDGLVRSRRDSVARDRLLVEDHQLENIQADLTALIERHPRRAYEILKARFTEATETRGLRRRMSLWWRPDVASRDSYRSRYNLALDFLLDNMRDALVKAGRVEPDKIASEIARLFREVDGWGRRLALHAITANPRFLALVDHSLPVRNELRDLVQHQEFFPILTEHFHRLSEQARESIHEALAQPGALIDADDEPEREDFVHWRILRAVPARFLRKAERSRLEELRSKYDTAESYRPIEPGWDEGEPTDELLLAFGQGVQDLLRFLRSHKQSWMNIARVVEREPSTMLRVAPLLRVDDFPDAFSYFSAYLTLMKDKVPFAWDALISACERLTLQSAENADRVTWATTWLLRDGLSVRHAIPDDLLNRAFIMLQGVLDQSSTPLMKGLGTDDLQSHQLNHSAGRAADGMMFYAWRTALQVESVPPGFTPEIQAALRRGISHGWGGHELRHAMGQHLRVLQWCDSSWLRTNLGALWPSGDSSVDKNARLAFWNGYMWDRPLVGPTMQALKHSYADVIEAFRGDANMYLAEGELAEQFGIHMLVGWMSDVEGFGMHELMGRFLAVAPDSLRSHIVWFLWSRAKDPSGDDRPDLLEKMELYWAARSAALSRLPPEARSAELSRFLAWPAVLGKSASHLKDRILQAVDHVRDGHGIDDLLSWLSQRAADEPGESAEIIERVVTRWATDPDMYWIGRDLEPSLETLVEAGGSAVRPNLERIVNALLEAGRGDLRRLLD